MDVAVVGTAGAAAQAGAEGDADDVGVEFELAGAIELAARKGAEIAGDRDVVGSADADVEADALGGEIGEAIEPVDSGLEIGIELAAIMRAVDPLVDLRPGEWPALYWALDEAGGLEQVDVLPKLAIADLGERAGERRGRAQQRCQQGDFTHTRHSQGRDQPRAESGTKSR